MAFFHDIANELKLEVLSHLNVNISIHLRTFNDIVQRIRMRKYLIVSTYDDW